jgi:hypothetical protein
LKIPFIKKGGEAQGVGSEFSSPSTTRKKKKVAYVPPKKKKNVAYLKYFILIMKNGLIQCGLGSLY